MKKTLLLLSTVIMITGSVHAQTTFYGGLAGQFGNNCSCFEFLAGGLSNGSTTNNTSQS